MTNLESYNHATQGMTLIEQNIFAAVFVGALSAILSDDTGRRQWARALETARNYPFAFKGTATTMAPVAPVGTAGLAEIVDEALAPHITDRQKVARP